MARTTTNKKVNAVTKKAKVNTEEQAKKQFKELGLGNATMELVERQYSVAKDSKRTEYVLTDKANKKARITLRGSKDNWMLISNMEHAGWTYHDRKQGSWWGKAVKAADAVALVSELTGKELVLG